MSLWSNRRGTTLPLTILVIALLSMAAAAGFTRGSNERRISANQQAQVDAFTVAQTGLDQYIASFSSMPTDSAFATLSNLPGGTAYLAIRRIRGSVAGSTPIYLVTSRGVNTTASRYDPSAPPAERTVAQYVTWRFGSMDLDAAFTSLSGLDKNGNSGSLSGVDACGAKPSVPGVAVPNGLYSGHTNPIDGNPDNTPSYIGTSGIAGTAKDAVKIDWNGIVNQNALPARYTLPDSTWPNSTQMDSWPVIRVNGNHSVNGGTTDGKGILIVTGNLTVNGSWKFDGIVLVGGTFTSNGNNTISGAIITGLNIKLGTNISQTAVGNGNKTFQYDSCKISNALSPLSSLVRLPNAWMDNWPSY